MNQHHDLSKHATELEKEIAKLQAELGEGEDAEKIVDSHIKLLHKYNEAKDVTQMLIGKLAAIRQVTVRELHDDYDLPISD